METRLALIASVVFASACAEKHGSYDGTVEGESFDVADAACFSKFYAAEDIGAPYNLNVTLMVVSSSYTMCDDVERQLVYPVEQFLDFILLEPNASGLAPLSGDMMLSGSGYNQAQYSMLTRECTPPTVPVYVTGGTLHFEQGDYQAGGNAKGTFELDLKSGDHGTGTFEATPCAAMETFLDEVVRRAFGASQSSNPIYLINGKCA